MQPIHAQLIGIELYFDDLDKARKFYKDILGLTITEELADHRAQFESAGRFICLSARGLSRTPRKTRQFCSLKFQM